MDSVNGLSRSHNKWSMDDASFESHVTTSSRVLPMTRASFQCSRMLFSRYTRTKDDHTYSLSSLCIRREPNTSLHCYIWVEHLEGDTWQLQGVGLKQESHAWSHGVAAQGPRHGDRVGSGKERS
ncbi:hypothetical protein K492DRAFT_199179 [Lichtheimia hyalospora FSU 10163]|nr:hypothetical protein K492DRAFT_199179 [Lichtheimia hyalospora FSU 10163]